MQTLSLKVGRFGHGWHAAHLTLSAVTCGWWLLVYAAHGIVWAVNRPTMLVDVPDGHRVEYRDGYPYVLGPDEYLTARTGRERLAAAALYAVPVLVAAGVVALLVARGS